MLSSTFKRITTYCYGNAKIHTNIGNLKKTVKYFKEAETPKDYSGLKKTPLYSKRLLF